MSCIKRTLVAVMFVLGFFPPGACGQETPAPSPSLAPLNPAFVVKSLSPERAVFLSAAGEDGAAPNFGYIPSPVAPERHLPGKLVAAAPTDPKYDMRDPNDDGSQSDSLLTPVRNQGTCGACWTFGTYGSLESHLKQSFAQVEDFSEDNLKHLHGFDAGPCDGGNIEYSAAYLSRNQGPVSETDDPYSQSPSSAYCTDCDPQRFVDNVIFLPVRYGPTDHGYIKNALVEHGGVYTSFYYQPASYNSTAKTYYYDDPDDSFDDSNHTVVIVGWDDNRYVPNAPAGTRYGAFIVRNSWGSSWGENGYFYVSYYDESIAYTTLACYDERPETAFTFDRVYYYDGLGRTSSLGYGGPVAWGANWFVPADDETLEAVGFYTTDSPTHYEIYVYDGFNGSAFSDLLAGKTGSVDHPGWYSIPLDTPVDLEEGDGFGVVVRFANHDDNFPVPLETNIAGYSSAASANPGESFVSPNGSYWTDVTTYGGYEEYNVCIKAYSRRPGGNIPPGPCAGPTP